MNRMFRQRKYDTRRIDRQYAEETDVYVMLYNSYADVIGINSLCAVILAGHIIMLTIALTKIFNFISYQIKIYLDTKVKSNQRKIR